MSPLKELLDAFEDDPDAQVIQAGTLRTTRGTAVALIAFLTIMNVIDGFEDRVEWLTKENKFLLVLGAGFMWAIVAAADAIARAIATGRERAATITATSALALAEPLGCVRLEGTDDPGWSAVAIRGADDDDGPSFLVVKGREVAWVNATDLRFATVSPADSI